MSKNSPKLLLGGFSIFLVSFLTLFPSFNLGLYGDDWLAIFRYIVHLSSVSKEGWNYFSYFLTPYGSQDIVMGLLYRYFGSQGFYYAITAYIFRMIAAFSLYPIVFYLTRNRHATFFSILFFSVTTTGFDSTGWLLTMPTYLTIAFFNIFLYFYIQSKETKKITLLVFSGLFFYLAYITASARMIGAPLFILSLEVFWLLNKRSSSSLKYSFLRIVSIFMIFILIAISGRSLGNSSDWFERLTSGVTTVQKLAFEGRTDFLFYPIVIIGEMFVPNFAFPSIQINTKSDMLFSVTLPILALFLLLLFLIKSNTTLLKKGDTYKSLITGASWILFVFTIRKFNFITFSSSNLILLLITGGLAIIIWVLLTIKYRIQKNILLALFLSFSWTLFSFFLAWLWSPTSTFESTHRYLTTSAVGVSIFFAIIISLGSKFKNQLYLTLLLSLFLILHIASTRTYINKLLYSHSQKTVDNIWSSIPYISEVGKKPLVFYFESDNTNAPILGDSILFGFPFHISLLYNLPEGSKIPVSTKNWAEVVSAVKDGQSFKAYGYPPKPIPIDHVYAFRLSGQDNLINITDIARQKLAEEK